MSVFRHHGLSMRAAGLLAAGAILCLAAGRSGGQSPANDAEPPAETAAGSLPEAVAWRLAALEAAGTPAERQRATIHLARTLPVSEMAAWHRGGWFPDQKGIELQLFELITRRRWLEDDPEGMMDCWLQHELEGGEGVFGNWVDINPPLALEWLERLPNARDRFRFGKSLAQRTLQVDPVLAIELMPRIWAVTNPAATYNLTKPMETLARNNGEELKQAARAWLPGLSKLADKALTAAALERDFAAAVIELRGRPDGKQLFVDSVTGNAFTEQVLAGGADLPPDWLAGALVSRGLRYFGFIGFVGANPDLWLGADLEALGLSEDLAGRVRKAAILGIARRDMEAALQRAERDKVPVERMEIMRHGLKSWASAHPDDARAFAAGLSDREELLFAKSVLDDPTKRPAPVAELAPSPELWLAGLAYLDERTLRKTLGELSRWDSDAIQAACNALAAMPDEDKLMTAAALAEHGRELKLRSAALSYLVKDLQQAPIADDPRPLRNRHPLELKWYIDAAAGWAGEDPLAGCRWVRSLPEGAERRWATINLVLAWAKYEPGEAREWALTLPADERSELDKLQSAFKEDR